jgi:hypothetical protein
VLDFSVMQQHGKERSNESELHALLSDGTERIMGTSEQPVSSSRPKGAPSNAEGSTDLAAQWAVTREQMKAEADALRADMQRFVSHHLLANLFLHALNAANESDAWEFPHVEYAGLARWHNVQDDPTALRPGGEDVARIAQAIGHLFFTVERFYGTQAKAAYALRDRTEIAHRLRSAGLGIRVRAYQVHEERVLRGLFAPFATELNGTLGFDIEDVIRCFDAIPNTMMRGFHRFREAYTGAGDPESIDQHHRTVGDYLTFDPAGLAAEASLPVDVVEAILSVFSLKRGEPDVFALEPSPFSILRQKPILAIGDGRYFLPTQALLFPAVQSRLEDLLNPDVTKDAVEGLWSRYVRDRGAWVETGGLPAPRGHDAARPRHHRRVQSAVVARCREEPRCRRRRHHH